MTKFTPNADDLSTLAGTSIECLKILIESERRTNPDGTMSIVVGSVILNNSNFNHDLASASNILQHSSLDELKQQLKVKFMKMQLQEEQRKLDSMKNG